MSQTASSPSAPELAPADQRLTLERRGFELLYRFSSSLITIGDEVGLTNLVTDTARVLTRADCAFVFDPATDEIGPRAAAHREHGSGRHAALIAAARSFVAATYREGLVRVSDVRRDLRWDAQQPGDGASLGSYLGVPMLERAGAVLGVLVVAHGQPDRFDEGHEHIVTAIAGQAAIALENVRLYRQLAEREVEAKLAYARALDADRRKDEFIAMVSHELRNPLAPVVTAVALLRARGQRGREVDVIERQAMHLSRLVDDLLDISRIGRGSLRIEREILPIADVLSKAIEIASPLIEARHHRLQVTVSGGDLHVRGDPIRLAQVVSNLLTNAARYGNVGGHIDVSASLVGDSVAICVADDGIGIEAELLGALFDPFVRGSAEGVRRERGLGLGLAICRSIVELHGGSVTAASAGPGRGSTFTVLLPSA